jgi:hypothetical protein
VLNFQPYIRVYHLFIIALASASYEKMCLLFNIGALQSQIAASQNLTSDDGLKTAAKYFQVNKHYSSKVILYIPSMHT